jgi:hypothetical protein
LTALKQTPTTQSTDTQTDIEAKKADIENKINSLWLFHGQDRDMNP